MLMIFVVYMVLMVLCGAEAVHIFSSASARRAPVGENWGLGALPLIVLLGAICIASLPASLLSYVCWRCLQGGSRAAIALGIIINAIFVLCALVLLSYIRGTALPLLALCVTHGSVAVLLMTASRGRVAPSRDAH